MRTKYFPGTEPKFGLVAWLEHTRVTLPLKGVECRFDVTGAVAGVELDQIYHQDEPVPLDCLYQFPLPAGAAIYRCELHVNGRVIRAKVEAKEDARRLYREKKAAGRRASLVEMERENLFTLSLGNVQPGDVIVIRLAWFQVLERGAEGLRLLVPTCPGVRYLPGQPLLRSPSGHGTADDTDQVPDASRISPPRIDALHPDAAYIFFAGRLSLEEVEGGTLSSPTHPIYVRESAGAATVELSGQGAVPDRDFVLTWREPAARQLAPQSWSWREEKTTYAFVQLRAPAQVAVAEDYTQDVYFLVDRSGSMQGAKWQRTCEALRAFVELLGAEDRVWITLFESAYRDFSEAPMPAPRVLADRGFQRMEGLGTGGGTELLPAARHVLAQIGRHSADCRAVVVLITDGQVGTEQAVLQEFQAAGRVAVHTFGIDTAVNDAFLKALARAQRGGCWLQTPDDDIAGTIAALGARLRRPVLTDLALGEGWEGQGPLPDLHAGEIVALALRGGRAKSVGLTGRLPDGREQKYTIALGAGGSEAIKLLWAKERIAALLQAGAHLEAIAVAKEFNLICEGAAFVAWDEAEQVQVAVDELFQPAQMPMMAAASPMRLRSCAPRMELNSYLAEAESFGAFDPTPTRSLDSLRAELRKVLPKFAVPAASLRSLFHSSAREDEATRRRAESLLEAGHLMETLEKNEPRLREALVHGLHAAIAGTADELSSWAADLKTSFRHLQELKTLLWQMGVPAEAVDLLLAWVAEAGAINDARLAQATHFCKSLEELPFSGDLAAQRWQEFLAATVGEDSPAAAAILRWVREPAYAS